MLAVLLVTFHGGSGGVDTVVAYGDDGTGENANVLSGADDLRELRGIGLVPASRLWVASGSKGDSCIACFDASSLPCRYLGPVAAYPDINSLWHPFDFTLDGAGNCFVSNQDTNVVARLVVAPDYSSATPAALASALPAGGTFLDATFVASSNGELPGVMRTTPVTGDPGLDVNVSSGKVANSVRGVLWVDGLLYVADEVAGCVKVYDGNGAYQGKSSVVTGPVHLLMSQGVLYTGSGDRILYAMLADNPSAPQFSPVPKLSIDSVSGMCFDGQGNLYAGSRKTNVIWKCSGFSPTNGPAGTEHWKVPDNPEFVLHLPDPE